MSHYLIVSNFIVNNKGLLMTHTTQLDETAPQDQEQPRKVKIVPKTIFGTSHKLADLLLNPAVKAALPKKLIDEDNLDSFLEFFRGSRIDTPLEGLLHIQLFALHMQSLELLGEAQDTMLIESKEKYLSLANRLTRTFTMALDALGKFKREGKQSIRVERILITEGSQALIGNFNNQTDKG
jgi:hypothetical protein